ncbi:MAG: DUF262 domain-containing HNH endonuclease family protein [Lachnospiraceae bacterium]|nr:DUF262 domain-containing HNH endonuclease family protein [Lachnospiraceae bacterium]
MALVNPGTKNVLEYFQNQSYYIPSHQREYSWGEEELEDLWLDIKSMLNASDGQTHFFGQIVIYTDTDTQGIQKKYIIDGQQRSLTSVILARAIYYSLNELIGDTDHSDASNIMQEINNIFVGNTRRQTFSIHAGEANDRYFEDNILRSFPAESRKENIKSNELIRKAFWYYVGKLHETIAGAISLDEKVNIIANIYDSFAVKFYVMYVESTELAEAYVIFETLNARGKDLETSDLLKNYIFSKSNNISQAQLRWKNMSTQLGKADATKYIRHFWNSRNTFTRDKALYREISHTITTPTKCGELLSDLEHCSALYHDMNYPDDVSELTNPDLISCLIALKMLKATTFYPVFLAMYQRPEFFDESSMATVAQVIEKYVFRNFTICGNTANSTETFFAEIAKTIFDGTYNTVNLITDAISTKIVDEEIFKASFEDWSGNNSQKEIIRYIFRKIHYYIDPESEINVNNMEVHVEHIMPQDLANWGEKYKDLQETHLWRLGNLCLLKGKFNISISNKPFVDKKEVYSNSKIEPNPMISEYAVWDASSIEKRQKSLYEYAKNIWNK